MGRVTSFLTRVVASAVREAARTSGPSGRRPTRGRARRSSTDTGDRAPARWSDGPVRIEYAPVADGRPDPGEIVWSWVPYEENDGRGKDRPVLIVGHDTTDPAGLIGLMLTSKDHDRDAADEARHGRHWVDIGTGDWDRARRPSEVRVDRVLHVAPGDVRREGATLDRARFDAVAEAVRRLHRNGSG